MVKQIRRYVAFDGTEFDCEQLAIDHESTLLEPCKLCGGSARFGRCEPGESTGGGRAYVVCNSCRFSVDVEPSEIEGVILPAGSSCWDYTYVQMDCAGERARHQWNRLMHLPPVEKVKPVEPPPLQDTEYEHDEFDIVNDWGNRDRVWKTEKERRDDER